MLLRLMTDHAHELGDSTDPAFAKISKHMLDGALQADRTS